MVIRLRGLTVTNNHVIRLTGNKPVIFLVAGNVLVDSGGRIDAGASGSTAGPGGNIAGQCGGLDRVIDVDPLPANFGRPEGFDALAHLARSVATLPRAHAIEVLLSTDLDRARRETFDAIGVFTPEGDAVRLSAQADDLDWFARELARLPFDFEVLSPQALRSALRRQGTRLRRLATG
jgi:hypothetical protein